MRRTISFISFGFLALSSTMAFAQNSQPRNLILFVPDGLRALKVTPELAPAMAAVRDKGVNFKNPHSLFPTFTMANASGMSTGHYLGDTGTFSNSIYTGKPVQSVPSQLGTVVPFIEHDQILGEIDKDFNGDYLNEETLLKAARDAGFSTRRHRQGWPDIPVRPHREDRHQDHHHRRPDRRSRKGRQADRHSALR